MLANLFVWNSMSYFFFLCPWRKKTLRRKKMLFSWNRIKGLKLRCFEAYSRGDATVEVEFESTTSSTAASPLLRRGHSRGDTKVYCGTPIPLLEVAAVDKTSTSAPSLEAVYCGVSSTASPLYPSEGAAVDETLLRQSLQ